VLFEALLNYVSPITI